MRRSPVQARPHPTHECTTSEQMRGLNHSPIYRSLIYRPSIHRTLIYRALIYCAPVDHATTRGPAGQRNPPEWVDAPTRSTTYEITTTAKPSTDTSAPRRACRLPPARTASATT